MIVPVLLLASATNVTQPTTQKLPLDQVIQQKIVLACSNEQNYDGVSLVTFEKVKSGFSARITHSFKGAADQFMFPVVSNEVEVSTLPKNKRWRLSANNPSIKGMILDLTVVAGEGPYAQSPVRWSDGKTTRTGVCGIKPVEQAARTKPQ